MTKLVTCGFTTFNSQDTIERALKSALNQDYKNIELLIVDDRSEDFTVDIINSFFCNKDISYRLIVHESNLGVAQARNTLLKHTNGDFLAFFDSDDFSKSKRISEQVSTIEKFEKAQINKKEYKKTSPLCYTDREIIFEDFSRIYCKAIFFNQNDYKYKELYIRSLLFCNSFPANSKTGSTATCMLCARTSTLNFLKGFNPNLRRYEDLDLTIRALKNDIPINTINKPLVDQYFLRKEYKKNEYKYEIKLINEHKKWLLERDLYNYAISFVKFKNNFLKLNILRSLYYAYLLIINKPLLFLSRIVSSLNTILFTIKIRIIKKNL